MIKFLQFLLGVSLMVLNINDLKSQPVLVKDLTGDSFNSSPANLIEFNDLLYFTANTSQYGKELWKSDGTPEGTTMIKDINPGNGDGIALSNLFIVYNNNLYFVAFDNQLWKSDGTEEGTVLVKTINSIKNPNIGRFCISNNLLFFKAEDESHGIELWKTDGSTAGTVMVKDIRPDSPNGNHSHPDYLTDNNGTLYFFIQNEYYQQELWKSDGTEAGTQYVRIIGNAYGLTSLNGTLIIYAGSDGLWSSDGSTNGTVKFTSIYNTGPSSVVINDVLYFSYSGELYRTDGTSGGTYLVKDIYAGSSNSSPEYLVNNNGILFFSARNAANGKELWKSDGTDLGTVMVKDIYSAGGNSNPSNLLSFNGKVFFNANTPSMGTELYVSDGTSAGTFGYDIYSGVKSSNPGFLGIGNTLFISASSQVNGQELFKMEVPPLVSEVIDNGGDNEVNIYPIPAGAKITIEVGENIIDEIQLYNNLGNISFTTDNVADNKVMIDISNLQSGIYTCRIKSGDKYLIKKLIKI